MKALSDILPGFPVTLRDLYSHPDFRPFPQSSDGWINDPERMERCHDAAEDGCEGSYHSEIIQDWRDFLDTLSADAARKIEFGELEDDEEIEAEIDTCEAFHEAQGTLYSEVG